MKKMIKAWMWLAFVVVTALTIIFAHPPQVQSQSLATTDIKRITSNDSSVGDLFGFSVAIHEKFGLISAPYRDAGKVVDVGEAYLIDLTTGERVRKFSPINGAAENRFGYAVALNQDYALISAPYQDSPKGEQGAVYIFSRDVEKPLKKLIAADGKPGDVFGHDIAINDKYALISALYRDEQGLDSGAVYLFDLETKESLRKLKAKDVTAGDLFGYSLAITDQYALVGAPYQDPLPGAANSGKDASPTDTGAVYVFDLETGEQLRKIVPKDSSAGNLFGFSVAMQGNIAMIGAAYDNPKGNDSGSVYVFDVTTGEQLEKIAPKDGTGGDVFGHALALNPKYAMISAIYQDKKGQDAGAVYWLELDDDETAVNQFVAQDGQTGNLFGYSLALSNDFALIGSPYTDKDSKNSDTGSVYVLDLNQP